MIDVDQATKSRLENLKLKLGGGTNNLYAVMDRAPRQVAVVVATCAEDALSFITEIEGFEHWALANTTTRRVARSIAGEPGVVDILDFIQYPDGPTRQDKGNARSKARRERRKRVIGVITTKKCKEKFALALARHPGTCSYHYRRSRNSEPLTRRSAGKEE